MQTIPPRLARLPFWLRRLPFLCLSPFFLAGLLAGRSTAQEVRQSRETGPPQRLPRQQARTTAALDGVVRAASGPSAPAPVPGARLTLRSNSSNAAIELTASGEGVFRLFPLAPDEY